MKRLLIIGLTGCAFALAPTISALAMPAATPYTLANPDAAVIQVKGGHGQSTGIRSRFEHRGWYRANQHGFGHAFCSVPAEVARDFTATSGMADMDGIF